jgi:NADH dehydrogenase
VLTAYEVAEREIDPDQQREWLTFVIVGGGPTGVELAGALAEISRHALARDFRRIDPTRARILLLEGGPRVLPPFPSELSDKAREQLLRLGVEVRTGGQVTAIDAGGVSIGAERIPAKTVLWAAGVAARWTAAGARTYRTDRDGAVTVTISARGRISVATARRATD